MKPSDEYIKEIMAAAQNLPVLTQTYPIVNTADYNAFCDFFNKACGQYGLQYQIHPSGSPYSVALFIGCSHGYSMSHLVDVVYLAKPEYAQYLLQNQLAYCNSHAGYQNGWESNTWGNVPNTWTPYQYTAGGNNIGGFVGGMGGGVGGHPVVSALLKVCPGLKTATAGCPECPMASGPVANLIPHINDTHRWTRERIADWLDTLPFDLSIKPTAKEDKNAISGPSPKAALPAGVPSDNGVVNYGQWEGIIKSALGVN